MKRLMLTWLLALPISTYAIFGFGSGISSTTSGHPHPLIYIEAHLGKLGVSGYSVGFHNSFYYQTAYQASVYYIHKVGGDKGSFFWGDSLVYAGAAIYYSQRGYRGELDESATTDDTLYAGPFLGVSWQFLSPLFMSLEGLYGVDWGSIGNFTSRNSVAYILGVRF